LRKIKKALQLREREREREREMGLRQKIQELEKLMEVLGTTEISKDYNMIFKLATAKSKALKRSSCTKLTQFQTLKQPRTTKRIQRREDGRRRRRRRNLQRLPHRPKTKKQKQKTKLSQICLKLTSNEHQLVIIFFLCSSSSSSFFLLLLLTNLRKKIK
jgi:hypothetical protein